MLRRILVLALALVWLLGFSPYPATTSAQSVSCASFDAWVWAQSYLAAHPETSSAVDPDGNGLACDELRGIEGFSPALWTSSIPANLESAQLVRIADGDTLQLLLNGIEEEVRLYRTDAPELDPLEILRAV